MHRGLLLALVALASIRLISYAESDPSQMTQMIVVEVFGIGRLDDVPCVIGGGLLASLFWRDGSGRSVCHPHTLSSPRNSRRIVIGESSPRQKRATGK